MWLVVRPQVMNGHVTCIIATSCLPSGSSTCAHMWQELLISTQFQLSKVEASRSSSHAPSGLLAPAHVQHLFPGRHMPLNKQHRAATSPVIRVCALWLWGTWQTLAVPHCRPQAKASPRSWTSLTALAAATSTPARSWKLPQMVSHCRLCMV